MIEFRTGFGFDVHSFEAGDYVILCGVKIPYIKKLKGHSDADVAFHSIVDAILGALAKGDIGLYFSPNDIRWKNVDSKYFLAYVLQNILQKNTKIINIDITIVCEYPKIQYIRNEMQFNISKILKLDINRISIKATTNEGLGFIGRKEGIAVYSVVTIAVKSDYLNDL